MTITRPDDDVAWRALGDRLWVARRDDRHIGAVERGRRWTASDADGEPIGAFRTLPEAQRAVADPDVLSRDVLPAGSALPGLALAVVGAAALASGAAWTWGVLLS
jgi:hypothetical protein